MTNSLDISKNKRDKALLWYIVLTFGISWVFWIPIALATAGLTNIVEPFSRSWYHRISHFQSMSLVEVLTACGGLGPIGAAIFVTWRFRGFDDVKKLLGRVVRIKVGPQWYLATILVPLAYLGLSTWINSLLSGGTLKLRGDTISAALEYFGSMVFFMTFFIVLEELGWRGFMQPLLQADRTALWSSVIVGIAWSYWHIPHYFSMYYPGIQDVKETLLRIALTPLGLIPVSILMAWVFNNTQGSVFLAMLYHAAHNSSHGVFIKEGGGDSSRFVGMAIIWVMAIVVMLIFGHTNLARHERFVLE